MAIAEQHAVTFAAGLAKEGLNAVVAIYSTFLQRAYDQLIHDVAIQNLPVLFAIDRAGLVGADGPTHQGAFDIPFLRCIPNMVIMVPADENECRQMLYTGHKLQRPATVRYPRGSATGVSPKQEMTALKLGKSRTIIAGEKVAILNFGILLPYAQRAAEEINATVIDMRFVKPLDTEIIDQLATNHHLFVSIEDGAIIGGAGSAVAEYLMSSKHTSKLLQLGLPDEFIMQGTQQEMYAELGLDTAGILARIDDFNN